MSKLTKKEAISRLNYAARLLHMSKNVKDCIEIRKQLACILLGHSSIVNVCMGEVTCGRCGDLVGDALRGAYDAGEDVIIHDCKTRRKNFKALTWRDKLYTPEPFKRKKAKR